MLNKRYDWLRKFTEVLDGYSIRFFKRKVIATYMRKWDIS